MGNTLKKVSHYVLPNLGFVGGAADGLVQGQGLGGALKEGLQSGAKAALQIGGSMVGGSILPGSIGEALGSTASNAIGSNLANTSIGGALGGAAGNAIYDSLYPQQKDDSGGGGQIQTAAGPTPFSPAQQAQLTLPGSLSGFSDLSPEQQSSNLATQGVYGGGNGPDEQAYFQNLINRRLVDSSGNVDQNMSDVSPIEQSYLSQLGLGGAGSTSSILEAISKWKNPQAQTALA